MNARSNSTEHVHVALCSPPGNAGRPQQRARIQSNCSRHGNAGRRSTAPNVSLVSDFTSNRADLSPRNVELGGSNPRTSTYLLTWRRPKSWMQTELHRDWTTSKGTGALKSVESSDLNSMEVLQVALQNAGNYLAMEYNKRFDQLLAVYAYGMAARTSPSG